jgi:dipeptidase D
MQLEETLGNDQTITDGVLREFFAFCRHPHGSWDEKALVDELEQKFLQMGCFLVRDEWNNLMADLPATQGLAYLPLTIVQGHTDMVCVSGGDWNPVRDAVRPVVVDGELKTDGSSSLGADNGLGNAAVLYLITCDAPHGPLRLIFTVAEENGLEGARKIDPSWLSGARYLINTDGFTFGEAVVSSAGARREYFTRALATEPADQNAAVTITLNGFAGGHSGFDIHRGRGNPIQLMAVLLEEIAAKLPCRLAEFNGGDAPNAIPSHSAATITVDQSQLPLIQEITHRFRSQMTAAYRGSEPNCSLTVNEASCPEQVWTQECQRATTQLLTLLFTGVLAVHNDFPGKTSASGNVGRLRMSEDHIEVSGYLRSSDPFMEQLLAHRHNTAAEVTGFALDAASYPGWVWTGKNLLADRLNEKYRKITGREMTITATHVGLEPSIFLGKNPSLIAVTFGPDILDAHSTRERAPLKNIPDYVRLLASLLCDLPD